MAQRVEIADQEGEAAAREGERDRISKGQERIRANIAAISSDTPLYRRYLETLDREETRLQELAIEIEQFHEAAQTLRRELAEYVEGLVME